MYQRLLKVDPLKCVLCGRQMRFTGLKRGYRLAELVLMHEPLALTSQSWQANWPNLATFFAYPTDIRKVIYTTNAIESINSVIRHAIKKRKVFPTDDSVKKVVWLAIQSASQKWTMPLKDWRMAMSRFIIEFGDRLDGHF